MPEIREDIYLVAPVRTPIGRFGGALASLTAAELGTRAVAAALERSGVPREAVEGVIYGNARQAGVGPNVARQVAIRGGLAHEIPAYTVNQACGSGLRAIINAVDEIRLGNAAVVVAGGVESMSNTPYLLTGARWGLRMGDGELTDAMVRDGFLCPLAEDLMGATAETLADRHAITRDEQDRFAVDSQRKAKAAWDSGAFRDEVVPVEVRGKKGVTIVDRDDHLRPDATVEGLAKLAPVFREGGTVHAGNSSGITDGAAAMIVASAEAVKKYGLRPAVRVRAYAQAAVDPRIMGIGPVPATQRLLRDAGISLGDVDLVELNEAFAAQVIACERELELDRERLNVHGGAIALGHPIGATGARIVTTLANAMAVRNARTGLATLCISGGMGLSLLVEKA
ncbi:MAG: thiolase family protein [Thermoanaerobaculia bacterium]